MKKVLFILFILMSIFFTGCSSVPEINGRWSFVIWFADNTKSDGLAVILQNQNKINGDLYEKSPIKFSGNYQNNKFEMTYTYKNQNYLISVRIIKNELHGTVLADTGKSERYVIGNIILKRIVDDYKGNIDNFAEKVHYFYTVSKK